MKFALQLVYSGCSPPPNHADLVTAAEDAGFDTVFTTEAWGSEAFTPLAWWGARTAQIRELASLID
jgi:alkanesulfonate monooxygenase SsuD/methylene tetrahydromethanopterin reductase-like flavin-dependent oxidoreductase (luciferase family)